jgi:hypothetical protein
MVGDEARVSRAYSGDGTGPTPAVGIGKLAAQIVLMSADSPAIWSRSARDRGCASLLSRGRNGQLQQLLRQLWWWQPSSGRTVTPVRTAASITRSTQATNMLATITTAAQASLAHPTTPTTPITQRAWIACAMGDWRSCR